MEWGYIILECNGKFVSLKQVYEAHTAAAGHAMISEKRDSCCVKRPREGSFWNENRPSVQNVTQSRHHVINKNAALLCVQLNRTGPITQIALSGLTTDADVIVLKFVCMICNSITEKVQFRHFSQRNKRWLLCWLSTCCLKANDMSWLTVEGAYTVVRWFHLMKQQNLWRQHWSTNGEVIVPRASCAE